MAPADGMSGLPLLRTGATVLSRFAGGLTVSILRAHLDGPLCFPDLKERLDGTVQSTLRSRVDNLRGIGALERRVRPGMPYTVENKLTDTGRGILAVIEVIEAWLVRAPQGPLPFGSFAAKRAIAALVGGWDSGVLQALAARPLSLTELDSVIPGVSYPSLGRRLAAMRAARQVEGLLPEKGNGRPYAVTEWTRHAMAVIAAASYCECLHMPETTAPPMPPDIEATLVLAVPLVSLPGKFTGSCQLDIDTEMAGNPVEEPYAGVQVKVQHGKVLLPIPRGRREQDRKAVGRPSSWLDAIVKGRLDGIRIGGDDSGLLIALIERLHASLAN
jgi:DNA-binding HxlR family transcriptional regulator